jgi:hypothetical protein
MSGRDGARAKIQRKNSLGGARRWGRALAALCLAFCAAQAGSGRAAEQRVTTRKASASPSPASASAADAPDAGGPPQPVLRGDGLWLGHECFPVCGFPEHTDPNPNGDLDGWGFELQRACIVLGTTPTLSAPVCDVVPLPNLPPPGDGVFREGTCYARCSSALTDPDGAGKLDGWGFERRRPCIVTGSAAALGGLPCAAQLPEYPPGDGVEIPVDARGTLECRPLCLMPLVSDPDRDGYGYEGGKSCVVSASLATLQGIPCDAPDLPRPPPPAPPPPGDGWSNDYSASMFGELDCQRFGFNDPGDSDLYRSTCVASGKVTLDPTNSKFFGAVGDLSTLWNAPPCQCSDGETGGKCNSPPACPGQSNCGQCVEVTCNGTGESSFDGNGITHNEFCKPNSAVVVQLIDACPHNHPNNPYWCTARRKNHIDISCSAFSALTQGRAVAEIGHMNVYVRPVDCGVGLGVRRF